MEKSDLDILREVKIPSLLLAREISKKELELIGLVIKNNYKDTTNIVAELRELTLLYLCKKFLIKMSPDSGDVSLYNGDVIAVIRKNEKEPKYEILNKLLSKKKDILSVLRVLQSIHMTSKLTETIQLMIQFNITTEMVLEKIKQLNNQFNIE